MGIISSVGNFQLFVGKLQTACFYAYLLTHDPVGSMYGISRPNYKFE